MPQFIQSDQLSPIQGTAGQQSTVQQTGPTIGSALSTAVQRAGNIADVAGNIYAQNRAQVIVNEAIEDVDSARNAAQRQLESGVQFTEQAPEGIDIDNSEWALIQSAVASGSMTREEARLVTSSRLRSRIAEQPIFADKLRRAASSVLGFNIESEPAQQYFASLPTEASLRSGRQTAAQKLNEDAALISQYLGVDPTIVKRTILTDQFAQHAMNAAKYQAELGGLQAQQYTSDMEVADQKSAFATILGEMRAFETQTGQAVDNIAFSRILDERKQSYIENFNEGWLAGNGTLNTPEYLRSLEAINKRYDSYKEFVNDYGLDNVTAANIQRIENARILLGDQMFPTMKLITTSFGQQVTSDVIDLLSLNETQRETVLQGRPELRRAFDMLNQDPQEFSRTMSGVYQRILNGGELTAEDMPYVDYVADAGYENAAPETREGIVQGLRQSGMDWKALSVLANSNPRLEGDANIQDFKRSYEEDLDPALALLAGEVANNPDVNWAMEEDGTITISQPTAARTQFPTQPAGRRVQYNAAREWADKVNQFAIGIDNGWNTVVNTGLEEHKTHVRRVLQQKIDELRVNRLTDLTDTFIGLMESKQYGEAEDTYDELKRLNPTAYTHSFDELIRQSNIQE